MSRNNDRLWVAAGIASLLFVGLVVAEQPWRARYWNGVVEGGQSSWEPFFMVAYVLVLLPVAVVALKRKRARKRQAREVYGR